LKIAICDDEELFRRNLLYAVKSYFHNANLDKVKIESFSASDPLLLSIQRTGPFDIVLLDIEMPNMNGIECAAHIKEKYPDSIIVFITSYEHHMRDCFSVEAFRFISKPINCEQVSKILSDCMNKYQKIYPEIYFSSGKNHYKFFSKEIVYIESHRKVIILHLISNKIVEITYQIGKCAQELHHLNFSRCHMGYVVNLTYVKKLDERADVTLEYASLERTNMSITLPISGKYRESFLHDFLFYKNHRGFKS